MFRNLKAGVDWVVDSDDRSDCLRSRRVDAFGRECAA